ncbi:hypothetical protein O181_106059 [Austropuccinia psidii MF-1]|uniref:Uncharacterized protein n=1 Tax=Austropuccinia psidii MF-1 TaxID=1389203 RepID=A0A9Q3PLP4_9BASI|nr:hypothetical protein [Austropuccinia psidii MF-1]
MPSTRSGASYNPSRSSQKGYRHDYGRSQSVAEGQGSVNGSLTDKLCHSEADNTVLPSKKADTATRSLCGHIQSQPEGLPKCIARSRNSKVKKQPQAQNKVKGKVPATKPYSQGNRIPKIQ